MEIRLRREEIIDGLTVVLGDFTINERTKKYIRSGIKILDTEPCEDVVSKEAVLNIIKQLYLEIPYDDVFFNQESEHYIGWNNALKFTLL